jgi:transposase
VTKRKKKYSLFQKKSLLICLFSGYVTGDLCYREVINKFNEKYPKTTISYVAIRKLVKKFGETGSSLNVKKIRKYLDENDGASVLVFH